MTNLLANGNFQALYSFPSEGNEDVRRITATGSELIRVPNIRVPTGWTAFTYDDGTFSQIEMQLGETPERQFNGHTSVKWFAFGRRHKAGLMQDVQLTPGRYQLRAWAHGWSNHPSACVGHDSCRNNPLCSVGAGTLPYYAEVVPGEQPTGDPWADGLLNMTFWLGVSIQGGPDITGKSAHIYNAFHELPAVEFDLYETTAVTCGIGCATRFGFENADAYVGEISLERVDNLPEPPDYGAPRIQYRRVVNVVPQGAGIERALDVLVETWPQTVTNSYDDAGIGALEDKTAVLWDIPVADRQEFVDFYRQFYPGTKVEFAGSGDEPEPVTIWDRDITADLAHNDNCPAPLENGWWQRTLKQIDGLTFHHTLSHDPYALARSYVLKEGGRPSIPYTLWITKDGEILKCNDLTDGVWHDHTGHENSHLSVGLAGNLTLVRPTAAMIDAAARVAAWAVQNADMSITLASVKGHQDYISTACPGWQTGWKDELYQAIYAELGMTPEPPPPPPPPPTRPAPKCMFGLHLQNGYRGDMEFIREVRPEVVKLVGNFEKSQAIKDNSPDTKVIIRFHTNNQEPYYNHPDGPDAGAAAWYANFGPTLEAYAPYIDYAESVKEEVPTHNDDKLRAVVAFDVAFCKLLEDRDFPARPIVLTAAIAIRSRTETRLMIPAAREAARCGGAVGYHAYFGYNWQQQFSDLDDPEQARHFCMRALWSWDPEFVAAGVYVDYIFTETGPIYLAGSPGHWYTPSAEGGWRWSGCMNGSFEHFLRYAQKAMGMWATWNATHQNRCRGGTWFTLGGPGWSNFEYGQYLGRLTEAMKAL